MLGNIKDYIGIRKALKGQSLGGNGSASHRYHLEPRPAGIYTTSFQNNAPKRRLTYSTIRLTMEKLVKKEILTQDRTGDKKTGAFMYFSVISREQMTLSLLNSVSHQVFGKPLDEGITMLCGGKVDSEAMGKLKEMVAQEEYVEA